MTRTIIITREMITLIYLQRTKNYFSLNHKTSDRYDEHLSMAHIFTPVQFMNSLL